MDGGGVTAVGHDGEERCGGMHTAARRINATNTAGENPRTPHEISPLWMMELLGCDAARYHI